MDRAGVVESVADCLIRASTQFPEDRIRAYERAMESESSDTACWLMKTVLDDEEAATGSKAPLCDDTGIPHVVIELGEGAALDASLMGAIEEGVAEGLRRLPGRPMAVKGDGADRLGQTLGMHDDPSLVEMAPLVVRRMKGKGLRVHILMFGGGPAIRGRSYRIFHRHDSANVEEEIIGWAKEACSAMGCTPCTLAIGIGRSHYEAANLMVQAQVDGSYDHQSPMERRITDAVNESGVGPMGMGGRTTALATFMKIGPARASGVRIACMRPCCCFEPRIASAEIV